MTQQYNHIKLQKTIIENQDQTTLETCDLWQGAEYNESKLAVVLECVFNYLPARELWRCGGVCRSWRRAAGDSALWRHLLLPRATPDTLRAICNGQQNEQWTWRKEYALQTAHWERIGQLRTRGASAAPLQCAALHDSGVLLALVDEDAHVIIWELTDEMQWSPRWSGVASAEWRGVATALWAPHACRLLLSGQLALVDRYEIIVLHFDVSESESWHSRVVSRSAGGPGGVARWASDDAFLSLRLRLLAPRRAVTTLCLNAATLEVYSEFAAVTTPILCIYNEASAHISHILLAEAVEALERSQEESKNSVVNFPSKPGAAYYRAVSSRSSKVKPVVGDERRILVAAGGAAGGERGEAQALLVWALPSLELPLFCAGEQLAERVQRRRHRPPAPAAPPAPDAPPPAEDDVRAMCSRPAATLRLGSQIFGIVLHPRGGCVWAATGAGAVCASLPALAPLLRLAHHGDSSLQDHYLLPAVDDDYFVTPAGRGSGRVLVRAARSGAGAALRHGAPALAAFLPPRSAARASRRLLVLATDALHVWESMIN